LLIVVFAAAGAIKLDPVVMARGTTAVLVGTAALFFGFIYFFCGLDKSERQKVTVVLILCIASALFWAGFEQAGSSFNFFADRYTNRTVGFVIPDRFHLVYLEYARAPNALGLHSSTGSRIGIASTAAGHAYTAALDVNVAEALLAEMEREIPHQAKLLRPRIEDNRRFLREHGYVASCGLWSPHINGVAVPLWSPQYQTFVVVTIGLLAVMFDEQRLHSEVAPRILELSSAIAGMLESAEGGVFNHGVADRPLRMPTSNKISRPEDQNELEAGTRRPRAARSVRARDGRR